MKKVKAEIQEKVNNLLVKDVISIKETVELKKINVLVSGIAGFIGSNLALELQRLGCIVTGVDDFSTGHYDNLKGITGVVIKCDISEKTPDFLGKFDYIFHQAAITDPRHKNQAEIVDKNTSMMSRMINLAKKDGAKLIYASSASVYGNGPSPMEEDQELDPLCEYAKSKIKCEKLALRNTSLKSVGLRYFNVFGPRESYKGRPASMVYHLINKIKNGERVELFKKGEQIRDHVYVKDVVKANILAMGEDVKTGVYNVGSGIGTSFNELVVGVGLFVHNFSDKVTEIEYIDNPYNGYQTNTIADLKSSLKNLRYESDYLFFRGLKDYMEFLK